MRSFVSTVLLAGVLATAGGAARADVCSIIFINGKPTKVCTPTPPPPPDTGCGIFCKPKPTR